ncbi:MAG TPA: STAS domain-containing protein [Rectinemataceae bacterium]|nr:STAS domain-containing protein [Rectinemataceae bacterium]
MEEAAYFKEDGETIFVRAEGHVTAAVCPGLKTRLFARLDVSPRIRAVYFDLRSCEYMDSTFLGLIVGAQKRFEAAGGEKIVLLGANEACRGLLKTIGVLGIIRLSDELPALPADMDRIESGQRASARLVLEAHEELTGLSEENKKRFAGLTTILRRAVDGKDPE